MTIEDGYYIEETWWYVCNYCKKKIKEQNPERHVQTCPKNPRNVGEEH